MSESSKMGLFGSKDESAETTDDKQEPVKAEQSSQERYAPYNIDSDSETYDTEALSIMDINDIIGIQSESAGDSTLESEFAALSEVITDIKSDDISMGNGKAIDSKETDVGRSDSNREIGSTEDKGSEKDSSKEDTCSQTDDNKMADTASLAAINKSLQLIGEAYTSDDSQDSDTDETPSISAPKSESLGASKNEDSEAAAKNSSETVASIDEKTTPGRTIAVGCSGEDTECALMDKEVETAIKSVEENVKGTKIEKSHDSTDSSVAEVSTKQSVQDNKTESMDVDSPVTEEIARRILIEKPSCDEPEESEAAKKLVEDSKIQSVVVEAEDLPVKPVIEAEEPMEVDEPKEQVSEKVETEKADSVAADEIVEDKAKPSVPVDEEAIKVNETIGQPEESKKSIDEVSDDVKTSPEAEIPKEPSSSHVSEVESSNVGTEVETEKNVQEEVKKSSDISKDEKIAEMKASDLQVNETLLETTGAYSSTARIVESLVETIGANDSTKKIVESLVQTIEPAEKTTDDENSKNSPKKAKFEREISPERLEQVSEIGMHDIMLIDRVEALDDESMEVDDNAAVYRKSENDKQSICAPNLYDNFVDTAEPAEDIVVSLKQSANDEPANIASDSRVNSPKNIETTKVEAVVTTKESGEDETVPTSSVSSENSADIGESIADITLEESAKDETSVVVESSKNSAETAESITNISLEESTKEETLVGTELTEHSANIGENVLVDTSNASISDKGAVSELETPGESSMTVEGMETEDIAVNDNFKEEHIVPALDLSEKSPEIVVAVANIIPSESSAVRGEEIALKEEKMEVDGQPKKEKEEDERSETRRSDEASQESEESQASTVQDVEEKSAIEKSDDWSKIDDSENAEKAVEEDVESTRESKDGESSETEDRKSIDETDEATQEIMDEEILPLIVIQKSKSTGSKEEENAFLIATQKAESASSKEEKNISLIATQTDESTGSKEEENASLIATKKAESTSSKEEENASLIATQKAESTSNKEEENASLIATQKDESTDSKKEENASLIATKNYESTGSKTEENVSLIVTQKNESDGSKEEENVSLITTQKAESSNDKVPDIFAAEIPNDAMVEVAEDEKEEVESESKKEEKAILSERSESSTEKSPEEEFTKTPEESVEKSMEDKESTINPNEKETESQISMEIAESSIAKIHEIEGTETPDKAMEENIDEADEQIKPEAEGESVLSVSNEKSGSPIESSEIETPKSSVATPGDNAESEEEEEAAMRKEEEEEEDEAAAAAAAAAMRKEKEEAECLDSIGKLGSPDMSNGCELAEAFVAMVQNEYLENKETEVESSESPMSEDNPSDTIQEIQTTETTIEPATEDAKEEKEESKSGTEETQQDSQILIDSTVEHPERFDPEKSSKHAEESAKSDHEEAAESQLVFPKPEAPQQDGTRSDLLSTSMTVDEVEGEEDPVEGEMNLSLDPDINECRESDSGEDAGEETPQPIGELSPTEMPANAEEMEDRADLNLSLDPEEKPDKLSSVRDEPLENLPVEDSVDESSMILGADKQEQSDERLEKPTEDDDDENSKDVLSTMACETQIFHDEQSQNTQEMMDSILETDSSNFNKVLDDEEGVGAALACANDLPLEEAEIDELTDKLPSESEELLNKALDDPMSSQNIDSLEGLLDLDLIQEGDESGLKSVDPIVAKVMNEAEEDIETKDVDVSLLLEETDQGDCADRDEYVNAAEDSPANAETLPKVVEEVAEEIATPVESLLTKSALKEAIDLPVAPQLETVEDNDIDAAFQLPSVDPDNVETDQLTPEESKLELAEDLLMEIAVNEERKMKLLLEASVEKVRKVDLSEELLLETAMEKESKNDLPGDLLLQTAVQEETKVNLSAELLLTAAVDAERSMELVEEVLLENSVCEDPKMELSEDISLERVVRDQVLTVAAEIEDLPANSEISELESAVKFLQESEEQDIDSPLVLSPKMVDSVVEEIARDDDVGIFVNEGDICDDTSALVAELECIIPDPIAISEAEIISEAAKLESERKSKLSEEAKLQSPILTIPEESNEVTESSPQFSAAEEASLAIVQHPETPKTHRTPRETATKISIPEKVESAPLLKKSAPIPKISILEERLKEPPKIEIPSVGEVSRICETPTTPKTSLLIQRDAKLSSFQKMLESPKASEKSELKIVDTPRKDTDKHEFENVGSPRIILKIAKSAIADCGEPRSPKSPKIRSATNSPNPEDSPGQKLGKIKLKLSKSGHPSIITSEKVEEVCGQWHTEGTSSLSPLGMKIKFSKIGDVSIVQSDKHEAAEESKEPPKHKFEEAKRTESPIGMKIKFSKTGDASIVQQDCKESTSKHKDKMEIMQGSPKRNESPFGMKIKFSKSGDASIIQTEKSESSEDHSRGKDKLDVPQDAPRRTESPLGMKFKLFKTGDASIVASEIGEDTPQEVKRTDSPLGMKIKLSKTRGSASIVPTESTEDVKERLDVPEVPKRTESPLGMKIKFSKTGDASIIHTEDTKEIVKHKERGETSQESIQPTPETPIAVKMKGTKSRDALALQAEVAEEAESLPATHKRTESSIGMKFKLSKSGDASIVHSEKQEHVEDSRSKEKPEIFQETPRKPDASIGMKIKFSKTGDASIIQQQLPKKAEETAEIENEHQRTPENASHMKIKLQRSGDSSAVESEKKEKSTRRKETDSPLEMKIKLSKTGHPTIVACDNYGESSQRTKDAPEPHKHKESASTKEMPGMKMLKSMHTGLHGNRAELTIEPVQLQSRKSDGGNENSPKRKDVTISPIESKKAKLEAKLSQILPEVTIQPIMPREQKQIMFDAKASSISRQQMNVISQEISITQVRSNKAMDLSMTNKLKSMLAKNATTSANADCEIIEHRPELIIVNENSNSSQDVMIIEEVPALRSPDAKVPKKRGRPRRNPLPLVMTKPLQQAAIPTDATIPRDPLALDDVPVLVPQLPQPVATMIVPQTLPPKENERPKRSCSRQKSYAPPRRGRRRGGGRGKRKMELEHLELSKKPRVDQDLSLIEQSTMALVTIEEPASQSEISHSTSELYKALRQPPMDHKLANAMARVEAEQAVNDADLLAKGSREALMDSRLVSHLDSVIGSAINKPAEPETFNNERKMSLESICSSECQTSAQLTDQMEKIEMEKTEIEKIEVMSVDEKTMEKVVDELKDNKDTVSTQDHQNWLTPSSKKLLDGRNEGNMSNVQVIDEETRMSAESSSRSQTPARNMSVQAPETIVNEESQGSVLSTATTESEKVKVKNRRMEINFDPDEGPFTVDKVAEYEWPLDLTRKSETFMIQEQISQYLGVKSFKRKYPDLKRRMVDMEERNYLRENALVSEAMCDMGLTAVSSSEVLDVMCNDFPDQYEEYRKYIREKQMKEHSKKQKELTAAANAERNRIDLAEMAVQSALSWNVGLNKARRESRKCSLDLQTFTIHVPKKQQKVEEESRQSHYPVALIPGQYTDYYREYTPAELRYYPLNTVLYGPMKPNERKLDSQSEGSQSDSDSDSSSDDTSSSSSGGTQDTEESQSTMDEVDVELSRQKEDIKSIKCKMCLKHLNKFGKTEVLIQCGTCNGYVHPSCIDLTLDMVPHIQAYAWQCTDCKTCAQCHDPADEDKMLFCDMCDRGYHIYCVGLRRVPQGRWHCQECAVCASCGSREAGGANSDRNSVAQWQHEYKKGDKNTRVYVSTLCVPCSKLWRKGRYCPHCSRCHTVPRLDLEANLVHCSACDKYLHLGCVETKDLTIDRKNYLCDFCQPSRQQTVKPLVSKVFRT